jgi:hypothetical protein
MFENGIVGLLGVLLGWLLGLLGQHPMELIRNAYRRKEIRNALETELCDIRVRLALTAAESRFRRGDCDAAFLRWLQPIMANYTGFYADPKFLSTLKEMTDCGDEKIKAVVAAGPWAKGDTGFGVKKFRAPFLASKVEQLTLFSPAFQQKALEIATRLEIINEEAEAAWFYLTKTFDPGLDEANHQKLRANAKAAYQRIGEISKHAAEMISQLFAIKK